MQHGDRAKGAGQAARAQKLQSLSRWSVQVAEARLPHTACLYPVARTLDLPADEPVDPVLICERGDLVVARLILIGRLSLTARDACTVGGRAQW